MTLRLFLLQPAVLLAAQINQTQFTYPISEVAFDNVSQGSVSAVQPGHTVVFGTTPGADDRGRQRVRDIDSDTLFFGRSSRGRHDGEVDLADNLYITIWWDARVWARPPAFLPDKPEGNTGVTQYKDGDIGVGDYGSQPPPVANAGQAMAGTIDSVSGKLRVQLPHEAPNLSFAVEAGATITGYAWSLPSGVTLVSGYALTDSIIQVDCDPGFYYVALTVTDSNGKTHRARVPIFARDPANDPTITAFEITEHTITPAGQRIAFRILEDIPASTYPDGTLVMLWEDEPLGPSDRSHMRFVGWHHVDPAQIEATRTGTLRDVVLECLDVAGKLDALPGWPQTIRAESVRAHDGIANPTWEYMTNPTLNKYAHYLLYWHSTALEVADFTWADADDDLPFIVLESAGSSLYDQVQRVAQSFCPDHHFTCDSRGRLRIVPDPMVQPEAERTATVRVAMTDPYYSGIRYTHQRPPRVAYLRGAAIGAQSSPTFDGDGKLVIPTYFCRAPGDARGQGEQHEMVHSQQLVADQNTLNSVTGHRYARWNAPESHFAITLSEGVTHDIEPAEMVWVQLTLGSGIAAQRGLSFIAARGLVHRLTIRYQHGRTGLIRMVEMEWEREVTGPPAVTELLPEADNKPSDDWWPDDYWDGGTITYPVVDQPPTITLLGADPLMIDQGQTFTDPGATASDPEDGDITANIVVGGDTVDPDVPGSYFITYDVQDSAGNAAPQEVREAIVQELSTMRVLGRFLEQDVQGNLSGGVYTVTLEEPLAQYDMVMVCYISNSGIQSLSPQTGGSNPTPTTLGSSSNTGGGTSLVINARAWAFRSTDANGKTSLNFTASSSIQRFYMIHIRGGKHASPSDYSIATATDSANSIPGGDPCDIQPFDLPITVGASFPAGSFGMWITAAKSINESCNPSAGLEVDGPGTIVMTPPTGNRVWAIGLWSVGGWTESAGSYTFTCVGQPQLDGLFMYGIAHVIAPEESL